MAKRRLDKQMKYFIVFLPMLDEEKSQEYRPQHLGFLARLRNEGKILANGKFVDGTGGLVIYMANTLGEVESLVRQDPYIIHGARCFEIHEWEMVSNVFKDERRESL
ncbi:YciI family protein [Bacillus sp. OTU530]|uniref:YciI family protein n=1 Tax=Bacillus sp. OTU530 TaxID=3043862 RepID=UPI00406D1F9F